MQPGRLGSAIGLSVTKGGDIFLLGLYKKCLDCEHWWAHAKG